MLRGTWIRCATVAIALVTVISWQVRAEQVERPEAENGAADAARSEQLHSADAFAKDPISWDADLALWTFFLFILLLIVLGKFAWKPIAQALEARERAIEDNIAKAEGASAEARAMLADYERKLASAADEVRGMLDEARRDAEHTKQEIVAEARVAAKDEHDRVMRDINTAKDQALKELAEKSTNIAVALAGKIVRAQLTQDDHAKLVQDAMSRLANRGPN